MTFHNTGLKHGVEVAQTQPLDSQIISPEKLQGEKGELQQLNYRIKTTSSNEPPLPRTAPWHATQFCFDTCEN